MKPRRSSGLLWIITRSRNRVSVRFKLEVDHFIDTIANQSIQRMRASRSDHFQFEYHWRLALTGCCKFWSPDDRPIGTLEMVEGTGFFRTWYDDGRLRSEVYSMRGLPTGRLRYWDEAGELTEAFVYKGRKISGKRYAALAALDSRLPKYDEDTATTST